MELQQLGPYRIVRELGRGGMGTVYEGVNLETGEPAAIKLLSAALAQHGGFRERFETEVETLRKLNHPNIVRLFGFGQQEGLLFYAMELVDGSSLEQELGRGRRFDWREVTRIGIQTCWALRHAHDRGVIHRDIKPANLLLAGDGQVKLSDFGIARLFGLGGLTNVGSVLGTAEYMAPEQAAGRPVGPRSDLYSLGGVFYALLTRRPLFQAESLPEILRKQQFEKPDPVSRHAPDVPAMLEAIIMQLLEKDPEKRIPNPTILARQLQAMERGLSLADDTGDAFTEATDADSPAGPSDADAAAPAAAADLPHHDPLPPTWPLDEDDLRPPTAVSTPSDPLTPNSPAPNSPAPNSPAPAADDLPETKATAAFKGLDGTDAVEGRQPSGHFVPVAEEDLDRIEAEKPRTAWISPQTWGLVAALVAVFLAVRYFLQPPTANALYDRIAARTGSGAIESLLQAKDDIEEFLELYPRDSRAHQLRRHQTEIELYGLEKQFERRAKGFVGTENLVPIERDYLEAINYAQLDPELGMAKLKALIDLYNHRKDISGPTGKCLELARRRLARLHVQLDGQVAERLALVQDRLARADELRRTEPVRAREMYRALIELYQDRPWAAEAVARARAALAARVTPEE